MLTETVAGRTYDYSHNVGRGAQSGMGFNFPVDMTLGADGVAYVVSRGSESIGNVAWNRTGVGQRVGRIVIGNQTGEEEFLGEFSRYGSAEGQLIWPTAIAADKQGNLYLTDEWLNRVSVFDKDGTFLRCWDTVQSGDGETNGSAGITIDQNETIFITDGRSHKVRMFKSDGTFIKSFGNKGVSEGQFDAPWGLTVDHNGKVYVADFNNDRVQKFSHDGEFIFALGSSGSGDGEFHRPAGVAVDKDGDIYVADTGNDRVQLFDATGRFVEKFLGDASLSRSSVEYLLNNARPLRLREMTSLERQKRLRSPKSVKVDDRGRMFVPDFGSFRVQVYQKDAIPLGPDQIEAPLRSPTLFTT